MLEKSVLKRLKSICGKENVLYKDLDLFLYGFDASIELGKPDVVVFPLKAEHIKQIVQLAVSEKIPYIARGSATNLCGGSIAEKGGIVIECSKLNKILEIDIENRVAVVEPGVFNLELQNALSKHGFFFAPDPASQKVSTLAGNVAMNAGGPHCLKYGVTVNHVMGLEMVLPNGETVQFGGKTFESQGYDLVGIMNGSEGTLGIVTKLFLHIQPKPESLETLLVSFNDIEHAAQAVSDIIARGIIPATLEYMDNLCIRTVVKSLNVDYPVDAAAILIIEVDGFAQNLAKQVDVITQICRDNHAGEIRLAGNDEERNALWAGRRGALGAMTRLNPSLVVFDGTVPRNQLPTALIEIDKICKEYDLQYGTLLHAGDGNIHPIIVYDERDEQETARVMQGCEKIMQLCVDLGGTITGEHGVGMEKRKAMQYLFNDQDLNAMKQVKQVFDPSELCNPGKIFVQG